MEEGCTVVVELVDLNVVLVVVGHEEFEVAVVVEIVGCNDAHCAAEVLDDLAGKAALTIRSHKVSRVVTVSCNQNVVR